MKLVVMFSSGEDLVMVVREKICWLQESLKSSHDICIYPKP